MSEFSKGKWSVDKNIFELNRALFEVSSDNSVFWLAKVGAPQEGYHTAKANANLIAAAPDMYEILKLYEQWEADLIMIDEAWQDDLPRFTQSLYESWMKLQAKRNSVLAKARGESHD